jgi:heme A synthase
MTLEEFKSIYWYEYGHRMLGRFIGAFVLLPGLYFIARRHVTPTVRNRILGITGLIGCQVSFFFLCHLSFFLSFIFCILFVHLFFI